MNRSLASLFLICILLLNGVTSMAQRNPKRQKPPVDQKEVITSAPKKETFEHKREAREKRESRKELAARRALIKRNPRLAGLFNGEKDLDGERTDQPREALEWYLQKRLPKGEKVLPVERYFQAKEKIKKMKRFSSRNNKVSDSNEAEEVFDDPEFPGGTGGAGAGDGSASTSGALGTWQSLGPGNVGGRTRSLIIDPVNPDVMYAAAVAGGIWKTTNGGTSWAPLNDFLANIAVTSMAIDPSNPNVLYAGTGEGFFNADGVRGAGIFKTTDAGANWTRLAATVNNTNFFFVNDIVVSPANGQHVYAATRAGVFRSLDGGTSWALQIASNAANGANGAMDLVMRSDQSTDYIFAAVGTFARSHIFRNTDAGGSGTWEDVFSEVNQGRTSLAIAPSNQDVIYAMAACISCAAGTNPNFPTLGYTDGLLGVFRSTSAGATGTWTAQVRNNSATLQDTLLLSNPVNGALTQCGFGTSQMFNQGWYDNVIAVDPTDSDKVWVGGVDLFRSDNGGVNWGVASYWWFQGNGTPPNNGDPQLVHADNHVIVFHPNYNGTTNQTMFAGDDGGVYKTNNAKAGNVGYSTGATVGGGTITPASPICGAAFAPGALFTVPDPVIWGPLNNNYAVTQFYHGLPYPNGQTYFGGTQDNGTNRGTDAAGPNAWARINGGDGGYVAVNPANTNTIFLETTGLTIRRSTNGGASSVQVISGISGDVFPFITVFRMDPNTPTRLWIGGRFMWRTDNNATNWTRTSNAQQTGGSITAMAIAPGNSNVVINGAVSGQLRRTTVGLTANAASVLASTWLQTFTPRGNGNGTISWVEYDPSNINNVWLTISTFNGTPNVNGTSAGHVFRSTDGGATWTLADGTQTPGNVNAIPDIPAHSVAIDPNDNQRIYVGTDLGVFVSLDGGANWARETTGFSNTVVESLTAVNNNGVTSLFAFTHGRGAFKVTIPTSCATVSPLSEAFLSPGGSGNVTVTKNLSATAACDWNAVSNNSFITINSGASGNGNGTVNYTVAPNLTGSTRIGTLTVAGRNVTITQDATPVAETTYTGDMNVITSGPSVTTATVRLAGHLTPNPNGPAGDLTLAKVTFEIFKSSNMTNIPDTTVTGVPVDSNGDAVAFLPGVAADSYVIKVKIDAGNPYWIANPVGLGTLNVAIGTNDQQTSGGGWVPDNQSANGHGNFAFTVKGSNGTPKGNSIYIFRGLDGFDYIVKSTSWAGGFLNFSNEPSTSISNRSSFKGRCVVQKIDPQTGVIVQSFGNFSFIVDTRDGDLLTPRSFDAYAITILDNNGLIWRQVGTNLALLPLGGGNVMVKAK